MNHGSNIPKSVNTQIEPIPELTADWSRFVTEDGQQLQTVGSHFSRSRPLNNQERRHISRSGVCLACHKEIPDQSLAASFLHHVAKYSGQLPKTPQQHNSLIYKILMITAWIQTLAGPDAVFAALFCVFWWRRNRRRRKKRYKK